MKKQIQKDIDKNKKSEKNYRMIMIIPCIIIISMSIPFFNLGFVFSGIISIIMGIVIYLKTYTDSIKRVKIIEETIKTLNDEN